MPKKFGSENTKATAAKARKSLAKTKADEKRMEAEEDEYWKDDDKNSARKQQRKDEQEKKRLDALQRKQATKEAHDEEMHCLSNAESTKSAATNKVTRAYLNAQKERAYLQRQKEQAAKELEAKRIVVNEDDKLEINFNRLNIDAESGRTIDQAISILSDETKEIDRHPEKRMKAAYSAFEETNLPKLKQQQPTLRHSQLKQILMKDWQKSPDNPINQ